MRSNREGIQVGIILSQQGQMARHECAHLQGTLLGIATINESGGVLGRELVPVICDPASDFRRSPALAERLIRTEGVHHLFGCSDSTVRKVIMPIVERHNALLWYPTQFEGFEYSPNIIYGGACPNQLAPPLVDYMMGCGYERFALVGSDFVFPRETNRVVRRLIEAAGGIVTGEHYVPFNAAEADIDGVLAGMDPRAEVIFSTVVGPGMIDVTRYLRKKDVQARVASLTACETDLVTHPELFDGHVCAVPYFESIGEQANESFLKIFRKRFGSGARANWFSVSSYMQVQLFAQAAERAGSVDVDDISLTVGLDELEGPLGPCRIDKETNYLFCKPRIGVANGRGSFELAFESDSLVQPDPYFISHA